MADEPRSCSRTGCRWPAAASLSYRYASAQVWLLDLSPEADPALYDLCPHHADHLVVPRGWERVDQRTARPVPVEPSADEIVLARQAADARAAAAHAAQRAARGLDAAMAVGRSEPASGGGGYGTMAVGSGRYDELARALPRLAAEVAAQAVRRGEPSVLPSRDLAPLAVDGVAPAPPQPSAQAGEEAQLPVEVPGQLGLDLVAEPQGIVVPVAFGERRSRSGRRDAGSTLD